MKRKTKILVTIFFLIVGLITLHVAFGLFTPYNYLTAKWDLLYDKPQLVVYGTHKKSDSVAFSIAHKFGFSYTYGAGCNVTLPMANGFYGYNAVMKKYIERKFGKDWKMKFDSEVDSVYKISRSNTIQN